MLACQLAQTVHEHFVEINPISGDLVLQAGEFENIENLFGTRNAPFSLAFQTTLSSIGFNGCNPSHVYVPSKSYLYIILQY